MDFNELFQVYADSLYNSEVKGLVILRQTHGPLTITKLTEGKLYRSINISIDKYTIKTHILP